MNTQLEMSFPDTENRAPEHGGQNSAPTISAKTAPAAGDELAPGSTELTSILALAQRTPGWNFRECPPQRARLQGGCELVMIPAWLWRPRSSRRRVDSTEVVPVSAFRDVIGG